MTAVVLIVGQAFVVSQVGFALGRQVGESVREGAERLPGIALIAVLGLLLVSKYVALTT